MADPVRVLITRPADDAAETAARLAALGVEPVIAPMLRIEPAAGAPIRLDGVQAVLVTSRNGARALAAATQTRSVPILAVGDATATLLRDAGFGSVRSAGGGAADLEVLVARTLDPAGGRLVHAAGAAAGDGLCRALAANGFTAAPQVLYKAVPASSLPAEVRDMISNGRLAMALFFSARTAETFAALVRAAGLERSCTPMTALCLSARVADAAAAVRWREIRRATTPDLPAMLAAVSDGLGAVERHEGKSP